MDKSERLMMAVASCDVSTHAEPGVAAVKDYSYNPSPFFFFSLSSATPTIPIPKPVLAAAAATLLFIIAILVLCREYRDANTGCSYLLPAK